MSSEIKPILIVDSERKSRRILEINLRKAGFDCIGVDTARDALLVLQEDDISLIISDTQLSQTDGFEFCRAVKAEERTESIPFLFLTHSRDMRDKLKGYELGVDEYLTKPAYVREIVGRIKFLVRRRQQELLDEADAQVVTGNLNDITLLDILETIEDSKKTGAVRVSQDSQSGTIYFEKGNPIDAKSGLLMGPQAVYRMLTWSEGSYTIKYLPSLRRHRRIEKALTDLVLEGLQRQDQFEQMSGELMPLDSVVRIRHDQLAATIGTLSEAEREIIHLFDGRRPLHQVVLDSQMGDLETLQIIKRLAGEELLEETRAPEVPQADDFDQLGLDIQPGVTARWPFLETEEERAAREIREREREEEENRLRQELEELRKLQRAEEQAWREAQAQEQTARARAAQLNAREREILSQLGEEEPRPGQPTEIPSTPSDELPPPRPFPSDREEIPQAGFDSEVERVLLAVRKELREIQQVVQADRKALEEIKQLAEAREPDRHEARSSKAPVADESASFRRLQTSPKYIPVFSAPTEDSEEVIPFRPDTADYPAAPFQSEEGPTEFPEERPGFPPLTDRRQAEDGRARPERAATIPRDDELAPTLIGWGEPFEETPTLETPPERTPFSDQSPGERLSDGYQLAEEHLFDLERERHRLFAQHKELLAALERERNLLEEERRHLQDQAEAQRRTAEEERQQLVGEIERAREELEQERQHQAQLETVRAKLEEERQAHRELERTRKRREEDERRHREALEERERRIQEELARIRKRREAEEELLRLEQEEFELRKAEERKQYLQNELAPPPTGRPSDAVEFASQTAKLAPTTGDQKSPDTLELQWAKLATPERLRLEAQQVQTKRPVATPLEKALKSGRKHPVVEGKTSDRLGIDRGPSSGQEEESDLDTLISDDDLAAGIHAALFTDSSPDLVDEADVVHRHPTPRRPSPALMEAPLEAAQTASAKTAKVLDTGEEEFGGFFRHEATELDELLMKEEGLRQRQRRLYMTGGVLLLLLVAVIAVFLILSDRPGPLRDELPAPPPEEPAMTGEREEIEESEAPVPLTPSVSFDDAKGAALQASRVALIAAESQLTSLEVMEQYEFDQPEEGPPAQEEEEQEEEEREERAARAPREEPEGERPDEAREAERAEPRAREEPEDRAPAAQEVDVEAALNRARAAMREEEFAQAAAELRLVIEAEPRNRTANRLLGLSLYELAQTREAIGYLQRATSGDRPDETALCILGNAQEEMGNRTGALQTYERYLELFPDGQCASYARDQVGR